MAGLCILAENFDGPWPPGNRASCNKRRGTEALIAITFAS